MAMGAAFGADLLPPGYRRALEAGNAWLIERRFDDIAAFRDVGWRVADWALVAHLPSRYLLRYTPLFVKQFFVCVLTVAWKLAQPSWVPLACVAEELALRAIIREAEAVLECLTSSNPPHR